MNKREKIGIVLIVISTIIGLSAGLLKNADTSIGIITLCLIGYVIGWTIIIFKKSPDILYIP